MDKLPIYYGICDCFVWPLVQGIQVASCGRCKVIPRPIGGIDGDTPDGDLLALEAFREAHGRDPVPFEDKPVAQRWVA